MLNCNIPEELLLMNKCGRKALIIEKDSIAKEDKKERKDEVIKIKTSSFYGEFRKD